MLASKPCVLCSLLFVPLCLSLCLLLCLLMPILLCLLLALLLRLLSVLPHHRAQPGHRVP